MFPDEDKEESVRLPHAPLRGFELHHLQLVVGVPLSPSGGEVEGVPKGKCGHAYHVPEHVGTVLEDGTVNVGAEIGEAYGSCVALQVLP